MTESIVHRSRPLLLGLAVAAGACVHGGQPAPIDEAPSLGLPADAGLADAPAPPAAISEADQEVFLRDEEDLELAAVEADASVPVADEVPGDPRAFDIPIHYTERVGFWMDYFQHRHRDRFALYLARKGRYENYIREQLRARRMPEDLVYLALVESGFSPRAYSRAHAVGLWQFIAPTARRYGLEVSEFVDERRDPYRATFAALAYLEDLYRQFGSWYLAAAAYNSGENRVERLLRQRVGGARGHDSLFWRISDGLPRETRNYVPMFIAASVLAKNPERFGFDGIEEHPPDAFDVVTVPDATELAVIARAAGTSTDRIEQLNPQFRYGMTPPRRTVQVRVPLGTADTFRDAYAAIPPDKRVTTRSHVVRRGETLSGIAKHYGTTVAIIQAANGITRPRSLQIGKRLSIPSRSAAPAAAASGTGQSATTTYRVRRGDSLWTIARRHRVTVAQLRQWNRLGRSSRILPGQTLIVRHPG